MGLHSPVEGVVLRFLPGQDVSSSDVKVDMIQRCIHQNCLAAFFERFGLKKAPTRLYDYSLQVIVMHSLFVCLFVLWDGMEFVLGKPESSKL